MIRNVQLIFPEKLYQQLMDHLFPGDLYEHAAVLAAGLATTKSGTRLLVRELWPASEPDDYRLGKSGYMGLQATFIHRCITQCRDRRLVYIAVHNHGGTGSVAFSQVDMESHERGYGALLDIAEGMPVAALVVADGAMEVDLWQPDRSRSALAEARVLGPSIRRFYPNAYVRSRAEGRLPEEAYSRQMLFLGSAGQSMFKDAKVGIVGLGGVGSLLCEYLARLGVGNLLLIDPDRLEASNISRIAGAKANDLRGTNEKSTLKIDIAERVARDAQPDITVEKIAADFVRRSVTLRALDCDFIFLAADTMRARLVFNAIVHQYYIPGVQLGSKVKLNPKTGQIEMAYSVIREVRPGEGCLLCNQLIDSGRLAEEWKTDAERADQQYGLHQPNPSVITLNAVGAAHAVNDFLFAYTGLRTSQTSAYRRFNHIEQTVIFEHPRRDTHCSECSATPLSRLGAGDARTLPCVED